MTISKTKRRRREARKGRHAGGPRPERTIPRTFPDTGPDDPNLGMGGQDLPVLGGTRAYTPPDTE